MTAPAGGGLAATGIVKSFGALTVLDSVSVAVASGEIVGLLGPNGAGKSTLVNILSGYERADRGEVRLDGVRIDTLPPARRARRGLARTFQSARLFAGLTVAENAALGALGVGTSARTARTRAAEALALLDLTAAAERTAAELPHGLSRLAGLARAITARPRFLVMDEPAAGLNEHEVPLLLDALQRVRGEVGCGMLLIEHNVGLVAQACSRVVVLAAGELLFDGAAPDALRDEAVLAAYLGDAAVGVVGGGS